MSAFIGSLDYTMTWSKKNMLITRGICVDLMSKKNFSQLSHRGMLVWVDLSRKCKLLISSTCKGELTLTRITLEMLNLLSKCRLILSQGSIAILSGLFVCSISLIKTKFHSISPSEPMKIWQKYRSKIILWVLQLQLLLLTNRNRNRKNLNSLLNAWWSKEIDTFAPVPKILAKPLSRCSWSIILTFSGPIRIFSTSKSTISYWSLKNSRILKLRLRIMQKLWNTI